MATSVPPAAPPLAPPTGGPPKGGPPPAPGLKPPAAKAAVAGVVLSRAPAPLPDAMARDGWRVITANDMNGIRSIPSDDMFKHIGVKGQERYQEPEEWFRYFWKEAVNMSDPPKFAALAPYFAQCLWIKGKYPEKVHLHPCAPMEACFTDAELQSFLRRILEIGFDSVPGSGDEGTASAAFGMLSQYVTKATFEMAWRADTRDLDTIRKQGYLSKAAVASVAASMNLDKPWHPFSDPSVNSRIWLRKGQTDNCLMTVVSVAERFEISLAYPKIGLTDALKKVVNNSAIFEAKKVKPGAMAVGSPYIGLVHFPGEPTPSPRMITFSHVYLLVLDSWVYETGKWQEGKGKERYPERAVKSVKPSNVIGKVTFLRIHHGPSDEDGFTAFPLRSESSFVTQDVFKATFGESKFGMYYQQALAKYREALYAAPLARRWETTGIGNAPEPLRNDKGQPAKPVKATIGGKEYPLG